MDCFLLPRCMVRPCGACRRRAVRPQSLPPEYGRDRRQIFQLIPSRANVTYEDVWCALGQGSSVTVSSHPKPVRRGTRAEAFFGRFARHLLAVNSEIELQHRFLHSLRQAANATHVEVVSDRLR